MKIISILFLLTLTSCYTVTLPKEYTFEKSRTYDSSYDKVWSAVIATFAENNVPIKNLEKASGLITSDRWIHPSWATGNVSDADCGSRDWKGSLATMRIKPFVTFNVFMRVTETNKVFVQINTIFKGDIESVDGFGNVTKTENPCDCNSKGSLEKRIFENIESKL